MNNGNKLIFGGAFSTGPFDHKIEYIRSKLQSVFYFARKREAVVAGGSRASIGRKYVFSIRDPQQGRPAFERARNSAGQSLSGHELKIALAYCNKSRVLEFLVACRYLYVGQLSLARALKVLKRSF